MKLALAQIDARLGDLDGICARLEQQVLLAGQAGADLLCLPAPLFSGVAPSTLVDYPNYEHDLLHHLQQVAAAIANTGVACLVPVVLPLEAGPLFEVMLLKRGRVVPLRLVMIRHSDEVPVSPWSPPIFELAGARIAVTFDLFRDITDIPHGCDVVIFFPVNGFDVTSEVTANVASVADGFFSSEIERAGMWMACMAPMGGFDESVYTGGSFVMDDSGRVVAQAPCFEEHLLVQDVRRGIHVDALEMHELPSYHKDTWLWEALRLYVRDAVDASPYGRVLVPMRGDLPSSLLAVLAVDALGPRNVLGLLIEHEEAKTPVDEACECAAREQVRALADRLHIRLIERTAPLPSLVADRDTAAHGDKALRRKIDALLVSDTAREQMAVPLSALTKTDYALRANELAIMSAAALVPFGDVYLSSLEWLAATRNRASAVLSSDLVSLASVECCMADVLRDAVARLELDEAFVQRAERMLLGITPSDLDAALSEHVDGNRVLEDLTLFNTAPEAAALLVLLTRCNEFGRRVLPHPAIVSARSFAERSWPMSLAWSDLGRHGAEQLRAADFADAEFARLEKKGEERGAQARGEVMGFLGSLLGLTPEQQAELFSDEGQQRMREELQEMEGNLREMFRHMADQGDAPAPPSGTPFDGPQGPSNGFSFFSLN